MAVRAGVAVDSWSTGCAFGDYDGDGWLDLYVAGYVAFDVGNLPPAPPRRPGAPADARPAPQRRRAAWARRTRPARPYCTYRGEPVMCGPRGLRGAPDHLFRNNGDGTFTDTTRQAGVTDAKGLYGFGVAWFDMDDDGRLDLLVANDSGPNYVYRNPATAGSRTSAIRPARRSTATAASRRTWASRSATTTTTAATTSTSRTSPTTSTCSTTTTTARSVTDVSFKSGIAQVSIPFLGWGTDFLDYDNDGWLDLLVVNGHVYPAADTMPWNTSYAQRALLFRNLKGARFEEVGAAAGDGLTTPRVSRGSAVGDLDNDGGVDVVINNIDGAPDARAQRSAAARPATG